MKTPLAVTGVQSERNDCAAQNVEQAKGNYTSVVGDCLDVVQK